MCRYVHVTNTRGRNLANLHINRQIIQTRGRIRVTCGMENNNEFTDPGSYWHINSQVGCFFELPFLYFIGVIFRNKYKILWIFHSLRRSQVQHFCRMTVGETRVLSSDMTVFPIKLKVMSHKFYNSYFWLWAVVQIYYLTQCI